MITIFYGIGSSILTEAISWLRKKLTGTPFEGISAQLVIMFVALVAGAVKLAYDGVSFDWGNVLGLAAQVWASAEVYYLVIGQWYASHSN